MHADTLPNLCTYSSLHLTSNQFTRNQQPVQLLVDMWFQFYFTPLTGVLFTFPSRYLFTIDLKKYVALSVSTDEFTRAFHVSNYSRIPTLLTEIGRPTFYVGPTAIEILRFRVRDYYPLGSDFPVCSSI